MKILQLAASFGPIGGMEIYIHRLSELLVASGHSTYVICDKLEKGGFEGNYPVEVVPWFTRNDSTVAEAGHSRVLEMANAYQPDIVLSHHLSSSAVLLKLNQRFITADFVHVFLCSGGKFFRRTGTVCTHQLNSKCLLDWYMGPCGSKPSPLIAVQSHSVALSRRRNLTKLSAVVVGSNFMRDYLVQEGLQKEKIHIVDLSIGLSSHLIKHRERPLRKNILFVGRLTQHKGVQYLIKSLALLDNSYCLTIAGDGYYLSNLQKLAARLGMMERVTFAGFLSGDALEKAYESTTVAAVPSIWPEPVGLVIPEPCVRGIPVVAFNVGGISEWADRYDGIYLAKHKDVKAFAEQIVIAANRQTSTSSTCPGSADTTILKTLAEIVSSTRTGPLEAVA